MQLSDLPDEILLIIFRKLNNVMLLYALSGVSIRLNKVIYDWIFTSRLSLLFLSPICSIDSDSSSPIYSIHPLPCPILDRYCLEILPEIHENVTWLDLESSTMERILLATNYPHLSGIGLYNISIETIRRLFSGKKLSIILSGNQIVQHCMYNIWPINIIYSIVSMKNLYIQFYRLDDDILNSVYKNQISALVIDMMDTNEKWHYSNKAEGNAVLFSKIIHTFPNIRILNLGPWSISYQYLSFCESPPTIISSSLLELYVNVYYFDDCLYLLDGRFNQLRLFHIKISMICYKNSFPIKKVDDFSFYFKE